LFQEEERKALEKELKKMEKDTNQKLTDEQKKIVSGFIQACKKREKGDKQVTKKDIKSFKDRLKEENLEGKDDENIEKIINYCMRFVKLEQELEAHIEILTIKEQ
jgi:predicted hydrolase (HD superfamily)